VVQLSVYIPSVKSAKVYPYAREQHIFVQDNNFYAYKSTPILHTLRNQKTRTAPYIEGVFWFLWYALCCFDVCFVTVLQIVFVFWATKVTRRQASVLQCTRGHTYPSRALQCAPSRALRNHSCCHCADPSASLRFGRC
jgi:hypothetical protein